MLSALSLHFFGIFFLCVLSMLVLWGIYLKTGQATWGDVGWSFNFTLIILYFMIAYKVYAPSSLGLAFMYLFWSLRLSGHLVARLATEGEDHRYVKLKKRWGNQLHLKVLGYFVGLAFLNVFFSLPLFILWSDPQAEFDGVRKFAALLWVFSTWAEGRADRQLERFRRDPQNSGKACREGLWRYSRHPNYFFEVMIWISFGLYSLSSPYGVWAFLCPALMMFLLFRVTGIPLVEEQALKNRGNDYKKYQETTNMFCPGFPRAKNEKKK